MRVFRRADPLRVSESWLRDRQLREMRNTFIGVCWNWAALKPSRNLTLVRSQHSIWQGRERKIA